MVEQILQQLAEPFPLNGKDIMKLGLQEEEVGKAIIKAKKFWADGDFKADKKTLINFLKK